MGAEQENIGSCGELGETLFFTRIENDRYTFQGTALNPSSEILVALVKTILRISPGGQWTQCPCESCSFLRYMRDCLDASEAKKS